MASPSTFVQSSSAAIAAHPYLVVVIVLVTIVAATYLRSSLRFRSGVRKCETSSKPQSPPTVPYGIPYLGVAPGLRMGLQEFLGSISKAYPKLSAFQMHLFGGQHNVVLAPSVAHQILTGSKIMTKLNMRQLIFHNLETFWSDSKKEFRLMDQNLLEEMHSVLGNMMREDFIKSSVTKLQNSVGRNVYNLVSFNKSPVDQTKWEWAADTRVLPNPPPSSRVPTAETNLGRLIRDFVSQIATDILMGPDFTANNPNIIYDLWIHDSYFNAYLSGVPSILIPPSVNNARRRLLDATSEHHQALLKYLRGEDPGSSWPRIDETSQIVKDRASVASKANMSHKGIAITNATIIWAMNINANQVIFWMIFYLYSHPTLLDQIRKEITPYVKVIHSTDTSLPIKPAPELKFDLPNLQKKCPLLQGLFFETMRLEASALSYKYINEPFTVTESAEDASIFGHSHPWSYSFAQGEYCVIPHGVHSSDARYFANPDVFDGNRFFTNTSNKSDGEKQHQQDFSTSDDIEKDSLKITYKTMHPWGGGKEICKGKKFAEIEVLIFTAAIVMVWDITPVDGEGKAVGWKHPGRMGGAGTSKPKSEVRVRMKRRV